MALHSVTDCVLGRLALTWRWRFKREAEGKSTDEPNLVCGPVRFRWDKFARDFDVELRQVPLRPGGTAGFWGLAGIDATSQLAEA